MGIRSSGAESDDIHSGFVLVVVIWLAGLIAALAVGFSLKVRINTIAAQAANTSAELEAISDGMARLTAWNLATGAPLQANAALASCQWSSEVVVTVAVQDQSGLVSLNLLPETLYKALFAGLGASPQLAATLAAEVVDFRDVDNVTQTGDAEPQSYAGKNYGPKNAPFQLTEELDQLPGMNDDLYRKVKPLVTAYATQPAIDPQTAPSALRQAFQESSTGPFTGKLAPFTGSTESKIFDIHVTASRSNGRSFQRRTMVLILRQPALPYATLEWQRGTEPSEAPRPGTALSQCISR